MSESTRVTLRLPNDVYLTAKDSAAMSGVSLNEYIVSAVSSYSGHKSELEKRVEQLEALIASLRQ